MGDQRPLTIVSNRGPAEFGLDAAGNRTARRGGGGLVTALTGLVTHPRALRIASAMTDEGKKVAAGPGARRSGGRTRPLVMLHAYPLYTCPGLIRRPRPDAFLQYFVHIPWSQP